MLHVGLLHLAQKLARVGGEAFHVAALALGVDGIEGEGGLAGPREAGDDHQLVARDFDVDILQVVLARAAYGNGIWHSSLFYPRFNTRKRTLVRNIPPAHYNETHS